MAYYYIVDVIQTDGGGLVANVPPGTSWVGRPYLLGGTRHMTYLIKTLDPIDPSQVSGRILPLPIRPILDVLVAECLARGLSVGEVLAEWKISGLA